MLKFPTIFSIFLLILTSTKCANEQDVYPNSNLTEIHFNDITIDGGFWFEKISTIQKTTIPMLLDLAEQQGKLENFSIISGRKKGRIKLYNAPDSDVYKLIEAAGYTMATLKDEKLKARIDTIIDDVLAAQDTSGYLNTQFMVSVNTPSAPDTSIASNREKIKKFGFGPENQWKSTRENWPFAYSQLYCAGHMMEAAVAWYRGTGDEKFLLGAIKLANHICKVFTEEKIKQYADHPQVEIGLMKLYELTGNVNYLKTANLFTRYIKFSRPVDIGEDQNSQPLYLQRKAFGHCVRTAYIYTAATDVVRATGANDLKEAIDSLWTNIVGCKMYIHGGTGNGTFAEQHGLDCQLSIADTYSECCANIAQGQWNHSLNLLTGESKYADLVELESYNSALSGISIDGQKFFYANKINIGNQNRNNAHSGVRERYLFCCPSKVPGFVAGIGRWMYAKDDNSIYINQFAQSTLHTLLNQKPVSLRVETDYPWSGKIQITFTSNSDALLKIRVPGWNRDSSLLTGSPYFFKDESPGYNLLVNGKKGTFTCEKGYLCIKNQWKKGTTIVLNLDMNPRRVYTHSAVKANAGRVALMHGPVLYALETEDNAFDIQSFVLPVDSAIIYRYAPEILSGVGIIEGGGYVHESPVRFLAIPYFLWQNRGIGAMTLLVTENPDAIIPEDDSTDKKTNTDG